MRRLWILGASDPEMVEIEVLIAGYGDECVKAAYRGRRVTSLYAYRADGVAPASWYSRCHGSPYNQCNYYDRCMLVECEVEPLPDHEVLLVVDHHRPGDPGYGVGPERYWEASSLGQVCAWLGVAPTPERRIIAAADHCLRHAYQGRCPGVDPVELRRWRTESRAAYQGRSVDRVREDVERAMERLQVAPVLWDGVRDMRGPVTPELPEAGAILGVAYVASQGDRLVIGAAQPEDVVHFMEVWGPANKLKNIYGDPERGFAGGYHAGDQALR